MSECLRRPYSEAVARLQAAKTGRPCFQCQWCSDWHLGADPGRVAPCARCGTLVTVPRRGSPVDAARGWLHDARRCTRVAV